MNKIIGEQLIDILEEIGIEFFFGNPGTEFAPIIERFYETEKISKIKPVTVPHEYLAVNMAYGTYLATSKPAAVMVHSSIGTMNAAASIMNAHRMRIPLLFLAGRTPISEYEKSGSRNLFIHWAQESFDQAGPIREYLKWDYELRDVSMLKDVIYRAYAIAMEEPRGPVYLTLPRELLLEIHETVGAHLELKVPTPISTEEKNLLEVAHLISKAKKPIILTNRIGESKEGFDAFNSFCSSFSIPVFTPNAHYLNLPSNHAMNFGSELKNIITQSDLIINLDMDVPWIPDSIELMSDCKVIHIGPEPLFNSIPIRSFPNHLLIKSNTAIALKELERIMKNFNISNFSEWITEVKLMTKDFKKNKNLDTFDKDTIANLIGENWDNQMILINELSLPIDQIPMQEFGSYFRTGSASGLGWACGCALGIGLTRPDKLIINVVGDGAYYFGNPLAYHWVAKAYNLPIITIILNNSGMHSITQNVTPYFKSKEISKNRNLPLIGLDPSLKFEEVAKTFDGVGLVATTTVEFQDAFKRAVFEANTNHQQVIINSII